MSILVNLSYYYLHGVALLSVAALPAWLVSIALPAAIAQYSHLIVAATEQGELQIATAPQHPPAAAGNSGASRRNPLQRQMYRVKPVPLILWRPVGTAKAQT